MTTGALSRRERQVVDAIVSGDTDREIAEALGLSVPTVKHYLTNVMNKWRCSNRTQVAVHALREAQERSREPRLPL